MTRLKAGRLQTAPETAAARLDAIIDKYKPGSESSSASFSEPAQLSLDLRGFISGYTQSRGTRTSGDGMARIAFAAAGKPSGIAKMPPR